MRPMRLVLGAFGPYADTQVIDFRELKGGSFFLIHGPTGSGKTSVLDGITFALYGDTSTRERQAKQMRSDHARPDDQTFVEFDFLLGKDLYRIHRKPEQSRPDKRKNGIVKQSPQATLWARTDCQNDADEGTVLATGYIEVTGKVEKLLGFKSDQFRQVVILPQGQFRDFLLAGSGKREEILEILFKTGIYRQIQETLKDKARGVREEWNRVKEQRGTLLGGFGVESLDELDSLHQHTLADLNAIAEKIKKAEDELQKAEDHRKKGEKDLEKITELANADRRVMDLAAQKEVFVKKEEILRNARKALPLKPLEIETLGRKKEAEDLGRRYREQEALLHKGEDEERIAIEEKRKWDAEQPRLEELIKEISRLEELRDKYKKLTTAQGELEHAEEKVRTMEMEADGLRDRCGVCEKEREAKQEELTRARESAALYESLKESCERGLEDYHKRLKLDQYAADLINGEKVMKQAGDEVSREKESLEGYKKSLEVLENRRRHGQAAILAEHLVGGEPCPVCGSREHPAPAKSDDPLPTEQAIEDKKREVKQSELKCQALSDTLQSKTDYVKKVQNIMETLEADLKDAARSDPEELKQSLAIKKKALDNAKASMGSLSRLDQELEAIKKREGEAKDRLTATNSLINESREARGIASQRVRELKQVIPRDIQSEEGLRALLNDKAVEKGTIERMMKQGTEKAEAASLRVAALKATMTEVKEAHRAGEKAARETEERFLRQVEQAGFSSVDDYSSSSLPEDTARALEKEAKTYDVECKAAQQRAEKARKAVEDIVTPDMEHIMNAYTAAKENRDNRIREEQDLKNRIAQVTKLIKDITKIDNESTDLDREYRILGTISELANGKNPMNITFQRYVQTTFLDDVLIAASQRLTIMSKGRFLLRRVTEQSDRRKSSGLDLEIDDSYTGKSRPVSTLSGGESFLAALSLALGLADVVQSYSGGMRLDTLFIDEGFGSLDSESLDCALGTLMDLRKGGRLVAIISHVGELRERIDTRLEIIPGISGSRARFVTL